jgi:NACalpha-BTF3-like transcription factor
MFRTMLLGVKRIAGVKKVLRVSATKASSFASPSLYGMDVIRSSRSAFLD